MLELCTGGRLHFGLMELAADQPHRFAGLGLMIESPRVRVRAGPKHAVDACRSTNDEINARVQATAEHAQAMLGLRLPSDWSIAAVEHPRLHSGLGLGTQLAAAVAAITQLATVASLIEDDGRHVDASWHAFAAPAPPTSAVGEPAGAAALKDRADQVQSLAGISGRGKRSAIGLHGFLFGGLVQDFGHNRDQSGPPPTPPAQGTRARTFGTRCWPFPNAWSVVLILSTETGDMCGAVEEQLIQQAGALPNPMRKTMHELSAACMAANSLGRFERFTDTLERYMQFAATLFASVQGGRYRNEQIAARVALAHRVGLRGVGQSSWGPTVFAFAESHEHAQRAAGELRTQLSHEPVEVIVTRAANQGASWRQIATGVQHAS